MNILLFGHTGFIGKKIYQILSSHHSIKTISSKQMDFNHPIIADDVFCGIHVVINAVGVMNDDKSMETIHHHTPLILAKCAKTSGVKHWINLSALGADEYSQIAFVGSKGRGDMAILALADDDFLVSIVRPSLVFGEGGASTKLFLSLARLPIWILPNGGRFVIQPIHVNDVSLLFLPLITHQKSGVIHVVGKPILLKSYLKILANNFYKKQPLVIINIPLNIAKMFLKLLYQISKNPLLNVDNLILLKNSQVIDENEFIRQLNDNTTPYHDFKF